MANSNIYHLYRTFADWFWDDDFWLPTNVTWDHLRRDSSGAPFYPDFYDLGLAFPLAVVLFFARLLWERYIALPVGRYFKVRETPPTKAVNNDVLEKVFRSNRKLLPNHSVIVGLSKQIDWTPRQIERWWRRRRLHGKPCEMQRFKETSWRFLFYFTAFWGALYVLWDKPWLWDTKHCWYSYPLQHVSSDIWWYYMLELSFYWSLVLSLFMDIKRKTVCRLVIGNVLLGVICILAKNHTEFVGLISHRTHGEIDNGLAQSSVCVMEDFIQMIVHHFATISLMVMSYSANMVRVGSLVLCVHDAVDYFLEGGKLFNYCKFPKLRDAMFVAFTVVWLLTRMMFFPFRILYSTLFEGHVIIGTFTNIYYYYNGLLGTLQVLHVIWFYMILRMVYSYVFKGGIEKDERSDTEVETNSEDEGLTNYHDNKTMPKSSSNNNKFIDNASSTTHS